MDSLKQTIITQQPQSDPNLKSHQHAEIIKAWADGRTIQWSNQSENKVDWRDFSADDLEANIAPWNPFLGNHIEWRIKPEVKTGWIMICDNYEEKSHTNSRYYPSEFIYDTKEQAMTTLHNKDHVDAHRCVAIIQISYTPGEGLE